MEYLVQAMTVIIDLMFSFINISLFNVMFLLLFLAMFFPPSFLSLISCHQSVQAMLASLHSELDIQRYLMKIQSPHKVSWPFILSASWCVCAGVSSALTSICCATTFPTYVLQSNSAFPLSASSSSLWLNQSCQWKLTKYQLFKKSLLEFFILLLVND